MASICSMLANIAAQKGRSKKRFNAKDFLLTWTMDPRQPAKEVNQAMPWQQMRMLAQMMTFASQSKRR